MSPTNTRIVLASRPHGWPTEDNFRIEESPVPEPKDGELLVRSHFLSLDPYMRGRMNDAKSYAAKVEIGHVMTAGAVGEVIASKNPKYGVGDFVVGAFGWQEYAVSDGRGLNKVGPSPLPLSAYLGPVGMPGVTAYIGLLDIGAPKEGETVVVSAASGAVGSVVGQIAKMRGCRAVGIAGGREKCDYVTRELGFDACIDYKAGHLKDELRDATPEGIDVYFENVGGEVLEAAFARLNPFARVPLCGLISQYNETSPHLVRSFGALLTNRVKLEGFIVSDRMERWPEALGALGAWVAEGSFATARPSPRGFAMPPAPSWGCSRGRTWASSW